jgi:hypothetical protein
LSDFRSTKRFIGSGDPANAHGPLPQPLPSEITTGRVRIGLVAETYYARRSARDPEWREQQLREAKEREAGRREEDPERLKAANREATRRCRERQAASGRTLHELKARIGRRTGSPAEAIATILADEVRRGRVTYHSTTRRFELRRDAFPPDVIAALRDLEPWSSADLAGPVTR